ncbi:MAG: NAD(P)H-hydrate epimerase [Candidatus Omnitrophota bacterium]
MNIGTEEMRKIEHSAFRDCGMPSLLLMENAGRSVSDIISLKYKPCRVLIFSGKGNNGGDGFVVARHLFNRGYSVYVVLMENPAGLPTDSLLNFSILKKMGIPWAQLGEVSDEELSDQLNKTELVVDAIFGIGIHRAVSGSFLRAILAINGSRRPVVSIDVPSGLDADTGQVHGVAVRATMTVTLALPKTGLFVGEGPQCAGEIEVADIGIPKKLLAPYLK